MEKEKIRYYQKLIASILFIVGTFLQVEHLWIWNGLEYELFGHETYGLICWIIGSIIGINLWRTRNEFSRSQNGQI